MRQVVLGLVASLSLGCVTEAAAPPGGDGRAAGPGSATGALAGHSADAIAPAAPKAPLDDAELGPAPLLGRGTKGRGVPAHRRRPVGDPVFMWSSEPADQLCQLEGLRARCRPVPASLLVQGRVWGPVPTVNGGQTLISATDRAGDAALFDMAGKRVVAERIGDALASGRALWGLERSLLHFYGDLEAKRPRTTPLSGVHNAILLGDDVVTVAAGPEPRAIEARRVSAAGALGSPLPLGSVPSMLQPAACLGTNGNGSVAFLPSFGDSPKVLHAVVREGDRWAPAMQTVVDAPFDEGTVVSCGTGWIAATEATDSRIRVARCAKGRCDFRSQPLRVSGVAVAVTVDDDVIVVDRPPELEASGAARLRTAPLSDIDRASPRTLRCEGATTPPSVALLPTSGGVYVIVSTSDESARLCAFFVDKRRKIQPVTAAP